MAETVRDAMTQNPVILRRSATVTEAAEKWRSAISVLFSWRMTPGS